MPRKIAGVIFILTILVIAITGCASQTATIPASIHVQVIADGDNKQIEVPPGTSVQSALESAKISLAELDRIDPPSFTILAEGDTIRVTRVREEFEIQESTIPFERQTVRNESLPEGQTVLIQAGSNGSQQTTYRILYENDLEVSRTIFRIDTLVEAQPEILMVGVQAPFSPAPIPGRLVYLTGGNAWLMEETTGNRRPLVTTGDLDGRILRLSLDASWLLFTRKAAKSSSDINTLWAINLDQENARPLNLKVKNVVHFADWVPNGGLTIIFSTVEPRSASPGWQANNDLNKLTFGSGGTIVRQEKILDASSGGIYGWWGTTYAWSPDGVLLAYARPDGIGLVNLDKKTLDPLVEIIPYQTGSDWAWVPGLGWSKDHSALYTTLHAPMSGLTNNEASPLFNLAAILPDDDGNPLTLVNQSGMFAYPQPSPVNGQGDFQVAYLQSIFKDQSETSNYRIMVMDQDGSNQHEVFPAQGSPGIQPQELVWSPKLMEDTFWLAVIYQNNLYLVNTANNQSQQITGDGLITMVDWR
ncbi:MAG TPA: G5 domain-containing protein [Longilinea sp.]|nr:G5 domain-containing protein [Longilinea sp.]